VTRNCNVAYQDQENTVNLERRLIDSIPLMLLHATLKWHTAVAGQQSIRHIGLDFSALRRNCFFSSVTFVFHINRLVDYPQS